MRSLPSYTALFLSLLMATSLQAQSLTPAQIEDIFSRQIEVQNEPMSRSIDGSQSNRGLSLVTIDDVVAEPVAEPVAGVPTTEVAATTVTTTPPVKDPNLPLVYAKLAPELQVNLNIKFGFDSAALTNSEKAKLTAMCAAMKASDIKHFRIIGHTDTSGSDAYNERLSILRAKEVARHLVQECGIEATRLQTVGMGERFPLNSKDTRAEENRRVEFQALS